MLQLHADFRKDIHCSQLQSTCSSNVAVCCCNTPTVFARPIPVVVEKDAGWSKLDSEGLWKAFADPSKLSFIKGKRTKKPMPWVRYLKAAAVYKSSRRQRYCNA